MTTPWTTRSLLPALPYVLRARLGDNECFVDVEAFEAHPISAPDGSDSRMEYRRREAATAHDMTEDVEEAERYLNGSIRADGCSNLAFDDGDRGCMLHFCGKGDVLKLGQMLGALYDLARELMPQADWEE